MALDSKTTYEVWKQIIFDEALSRAVIEGTHRELAASRGFGEEEMAVLDWFHAEPGTRWNIENLRFRAALETAAAVLIHLPATARILTKGDEDWLQDICYEYLSYHRWDGLGHRRLTECERFGDYIRERIMKRRATPPHLEPVMELELAIVEVLKKTADVPPEAWAPPVRPPEAELLAARPRRGIAQRLLEQEHDVREFVSAARQGEPRVRPGPVTWLINVPSQREGHRMKLVSEGAREVLERCTGRATAGEIAAALEDEFELPQADVLELIGTWIDEGVLRV